MNKSLLKYFVIALVSFLAGLLVCLNFFIDYGNRNHAREETRMAEWNRELAIKNGDVTMQRYLEQVIVWNTVNHLSPAYRNNKPLVLDDTWVFPESSKESKGYKRSKGDWDDMNLIDTGVQNGLIIYHQER